MNIKDLIIKKIRPNGKIDFLSSLPSAALILDVGCGNNSPYRVKKILPQSIYTGIDVGDYNQTENNNADRYIITSPENFSSEISKFSDEFDAVISSHNLEHCDHRDETLEAMLRALKVGGKLFLSFPCEQSTLFPKRGGTLNYFDDPTHKFNPPKFDALISTLKKYEFEVVYSNNNYQPTLLWLVGLFLEPFSRIKNKNLIGTWEYYGFESIIIAKKTQTSTFAS
jgi:SAM-dependent methyltransferase